jgi:DNA replication initiation complex subunit (GINS family)
MHDANWKANKEFIDAKIANMKSILENEDATQKLNKILNDLYAENARLCEALKMILEQFPKNYEVRINEIAREALKGGE